VSVHGKRLLAQNYFMPYVSLGPKACIIFLQREHCVRGFDSGRGMDACLFFLCLVLL
jgi:hypothetical protein